MDGKEATGISTHATGSFETKYWDEQRFHEIGDGAKLSRVSVKPAFHGDIEGDEAVECLMMFRTWFAGFAGLQRVDGRVGGRSGSFVLQVSGTFADIVAKGTRSVVPGPGTGDLRRLQGEGGFAVPHGSAAANILDYDVG